MLAPNRIKFTKRFSTLIIVLVFCLESLPASRAMGQERDAIEPPSHGPTQSSEEEKEDSDEDLGQGQNAISHPTQSIEKWTQRLSLSASAWSAAYGDQQKNHVTQATKNVSGLAVKGQTIGISWLQERNSDGELPQAWLYQGSLSSWKPKSEYWLSSSVIQLEGGFGIIPASGPKMVFLGLRYQKNSHAETTEKWSEVTLADQALLTIGTELRHSVLETDWGFSIYLKGKGYALFWGEKYSGYGAEAIIGISQIFGDDWRLNVGLGVEQLQISGEAASPFGAPLTLLSEVESYPMVLSIEF
jgi:hypothetical protein